MTFEMVDSYQRQVQAEGQGLSIHHTDQERPHQTGSGSHRDTVDLLQLHSGLLQRTVDHRSDSLHMGSAGQLRHDAAEDAVHVLGQNYHRF
jgi:hypothetical protein